MFLSIDLLTLEPNKFNVTVLYKCASCVSPVGIKDDGTIVLVMVSQKSNMVTSTSTSGMSLFELADFLKNLGVEKALNLDGGSSSSLYYQGQSFYGKIDTDGKAVRRPVKSFLILGKS